ncbi:MAG: ABC transporter permease [Rhodocyclaceae bacterium]|nr:ABC transporter permease [Rhodocyclaceae bacterium]
MFCLRLEQKGGETWVQLAGALTLALLCEDREIRHRLAAASAAAVGWDLTRLERLDSAGALTLWQLWGEKWPPRLAITPGQRQTIERIARLPLPADDSPSTPKRGPIERWGITVAAWGSHLVDFVRLLGELAQDALHLVRHPADFPWRELSAHLYKAGVRALPITALVGFLIGVVLAYLSSLQLMRFGADVFIVHVIGYGVIRELGPMLVAVLLAGRSGSAMTAQLGTMRVTEEIDALAAMGVSTTLRLVLPKVLALTLAMPLVTLWATAAAILGGMVVAEAQLGIGYGFFLESLPRAVPVANLYIGLTKGLVFGTTVALIACHFGLRSAPNTESLSSHTTASVVAAITAVIVLDALLAVMTRRIGLPGV